MWPMKNDQHFRILLKSLPLCVCLRHMPINENRYVLFNHFHQQMAGNWFLAVMSYQHRKIILADEFQNFRSIFLAIQFWNIHRSPLVYKSISFPSHPISNLQLSNYALPITIYFPTG